METLVQDVRFAWRVLRQAPAYALLAVAAIALGIGASTSIYSVLDGVLLRPLPFREPARLARIHEVRPDGGDNFWSPANYVELANEVKAFSSVAAYYDFSWNMRGPEGSERVEVAAVTWQFFATLGVSPALGRDYARGEDLDGVERMAVVSHAFYRRVLASDPAAIGRTVTLSERPVRIIGVLPADFRFPGLRRVEVFVPVRLDKDDLRNRGSHYFRTLGRLAPGETLEHAQSDLKLIAARIAERDPASHTGWTARAVELRSELVKPVSGTLHLLLGAVLLLLLVACANVAGLQLAHGAGRQRELAIRAAIGGGRARILRQLLTETLLLALAGGLLGLLLSWWAVDALVSLAPPNLPRLDEVKLDGRVAAFAVVLSFVTGVLAGLWPALHASRTNLLDALKDGGHGSAGPARTRARGGLVVAEIALAVVLVIGAGLLVRSFRRVLDVSLGFTPDHVLTGEVGVPFGRFKDGKPFSDFFLGLTERMAQLPGVTSAAATTVLPLGDEGNFLNDFHLQGGPILPAGQAVNAQLTWVTPGYFETLRVPLRNGRLFDSRDGWRTNPVVVVNEAFVRAHLGGREPVGARLNILNGRWDDGADKWLWTIVGVVGDAHEWGADADPRPQIFIDIAQQPSSTMTLLIRTAGEPLAAAEMVRKELTAIDPSLPLAKVKTLEDTSATSLGPRRFQMLLLSLFGLSALLLSALGIYGLVAQSVAERTQEFGIRRALGAQAWSVLGLVLRQGLRLTAIGVSLGLCGALAMSRLLAASLFGVAATDPVTYLGVAGLLATVTALASFLPARRATRVEPAVALRS